jgi:hypothetical protein
VANSQNTRTIRSYPKFLTGQRIVVVTLVVFIAAVVSILLARPAPTTAPSAAEIAQAVNGPVKFQRPSAMEYVAKTGSCVVGGTVTSAKWHVGGKTVDVAPNDGNTVDYTEFGFKSDEGREFIVSDRGALYPYPGENLGLELDCDPATMSTDPSFEKIRIIWGGK